MSLISDLTEFLNRIPSIHRIKSTTFFCRIFRYPRRQTGPDGSVLKSAKLAEGFVTGHKLSEMELNGHIMSYLELNTMRNLARRVPYFDFNMNGGLFQIEDRPHSTRNFIYRFVRGIHFILSNKKGKVQIFAVKTSGLSSLNIFMLRVSCWKRRLHDLEIRESLNKNSFFIRWCSKL